jgi:membrane protease YdiL (CAAX protease family)
VRRTDSPGPLPPALEAPSDAGTPQRDAGAIAAEREGPLASHQRRCLDWWDVCQLTLLFVVNQYIVSGGLRLIMGNDVPSESKFLYLIVGQVAAFVFPGVFALVQYRRRSPDLSGHRWPPKLVVPLVLILSLPLVFLLKELAPEPELLCGLPLLMHTAPRASLSTPGLIDVVIIIPLVEEVFFCGVIGRNLVDRYGASRGIVMGSLIFAASRFGGFQLRGALLLGFMCQIVALKYNSLLAPVLLHAVTNLYGYHFDPIRNETALSLAATAAVAGFAVAGLIGHFAPVAHPRSDEVPEVVGTSTPDLPVRTAGKLGGRAAWAIALCVVASLPFYLMLIWHYAAPTRINGMPVR